MQHTSPLPTGPTLSADPGGLRAIADMAGLRRIHIVAWRDLEDPEAGGSELHAATVARLWAGAGIDVTMRTSKAPEMPAKVDRDGYRVVRKGGRFDVFARAPIAEMLGRHGRRDALVEIWNGMPFFTPVWARRPRTVWLHHVHDVMWPMTLGRRLGAAGRLVETRVAPPFYRRTPVVTLGDSSKRELVAHLGLAPGLVTVVPPGLDPSFTPGGTRSPVPFVLAVGRLAPVKRFDLLVESLVKAKTEVPALEAVIVGEGFLRVELERQIAAAGACDWLRLAGRVDQDDLVDLYRRAWLVASASAAEGWGMTLTEAAGCGTPAVATRIGGHEDAVVDGTSGLLVHDGDLGSAITKVLLDRDLRDRLSGGALDHAGRLTWEATALGTLRVVADDARRCRPRS